MSIDREKLIEIARECTRYRHAYRASWLSQTYCPFHIDELEKLAQRIEQPHKQRIAELEKDCDILATNYDAARRASQFSADVADQALADLKAAEKQVEQLREALLKIKEHDEKLMYAACPDCDYLGTCEKTGICKCMPHSKAGEIASKALEQTK